MPEIMTNQFVAINCTKTAGEAAAITAGGFLKDIPKGVHYIINEKSEVVVSEAMVLAAKNFRIVHSIGDSYLESRKFTLADIKSISGNTPKVYQGKRVIIGKMAGLTEVNANIVAGNSYSVGADLIHNINPDIPMSSFIGAGVANATGELMADLYTDISGALYKNDFFSEYFISAVHTNAADLGAGVSITVAKGDSTFAVTAGTVTKGTLIAFQDAEVGPLPRPRAVYKVVAIDPVSNTGILNQAWISESLTAGAVETVAADDTADWAFYMESIPNIFKDTHYDQFIGTDYIFLSHEPSNFDMEDITEFAGVASQGDWREVAFAQAMQYQREGQVSDRFVHFAVEGKMYGAISINLETRPTSLSQIGISKTVLNIHLEKGTVAETAAGTVITYGTNVLEGTGITDSPAGSIANIINIIGKAAGVLGAGLNTVADGGLQLKPNLDF